MFGAEIKGKRRGKRKVVEGRRKKRRRQRGK